MCLVGRRREFKSYGQVRHESGFLTGLLSPGYEVLWVRILSTFGLPTSRDFALIVAGFLPGFSVGGERVYRG